MANAVEEALKRASKSQEFQKASEALRSNDVTLAQNNSKTAPQKGNAVEDAVSRATKNQEFQQASETLKNNDVSVAQDVDKVSPSNASSNAPANPKDLDKKQLDADTKSNIESTQRGEGNNYQNKNAVDRAQERPSQEPQKPEQEPDKER